MDRIKNNEKKYSAVKKEMETYLKDIDVKVSNQIPISAKFGDNIVKKSKSYKQQEREEKKSFKMIINENEIPKSLSEFTIIKSLNG